MIALITPLSLLNRIEFKPQAVECTSGRCDSQADLASTVRTALIGYETLFGPPCAGVHHDLYQEVLATSDNQNWKTLKETAKLPSSCADIEHSAVINLEAGGICLT